MERNNNKVLFITLGLCVLSLIYGCKSTKANVKEKEVKGCGNFLLYKEIAERTVLVINLNNKESKLGPGVYNYNLENINTNNIDVFVDKHVSPSFYYGYCNDIQIEGFEVLKYNPVKGVLKLRISKLIENNEKTLKVELNISDAVFSLNSDLIKVDREYLSFNFKDRSYN